MKKNSLKIKVLFYLTIFILLMLGGILVLQMFSLDVYFEWNKQYSIKRAVPKILDLYKAENIEALDKLSYQKDICIEITQDGQIIYTTDSVSRGCFASNSKEINDHKLEFMLSNKKTVMFGVVNSKFNNKSLVYGVKIDNNTYAFVSTSLEPVSSTTATMKSHLIIILIVILIISALLAFLISKAISTPIERITATCKEMSNGNYNVKFDAGTDIEEINELELTLNNAALELSKTENLRRDLLANVSHDLKTPLTLIKANAEMVKDLTYKDKNKREKNLNTILEEVDRLNLLVEDILNLSKLQSNADSLNIEKFNLSDMIKSIIRKFDILCDTEGYKINYKGFDVEICADRKKMEQVMYNLINNAINYTGENKLVYINLIDNDTYITVEVIDTGKGINEEDLKYIWDRYYKIDKKYKRVTHGTGLGLSIVKNILIEHNFDYGVESNKSGTKFYLKIKKN